MQHLQVSILQTYSEMIRGEMDKVLRLKLVALVTVEIHARDVIDKLLKADCNDVDAFEWLSQLRFYFDSVISTVLESEQNCSQLKSATLLSLTSH